MTPEELKERLTDFGAATVKFCRLIRARSGGLDIANQLSDSSTSMGANYRSACRARSRREFVARLGVAIEEADETVGWFDLIVRSELASTEESSRLRQEAGELLKILAKSKRTAEGGLGAARG